MAGSFYELLGVPPDASLDEIKKAFRREIAKYHPDKVQHLGREFQEIAAVKAADLTQAYKTLIDESLRAEYDAELASQKARPAGADSGSGSRGDGADRRTHSPAPPAAESAARPTARPASQEAGRSDAATAGRAGVDDLVRKAAVARFRQAIAAEFGQCDETPIPGFEIACAPPKGRFWGKMPPRILARVVPQVDGAVVAETWGLAARMPRDKDAQREVCIFLMGPAVAPAGELAHAIAEARRKPVPTKLFLIPVNTRSWAAHIPADAPAAVKSIVGRLKSI
ncbi:MAG: J domain-containing protein [Acidobacteria bacterium]|nr:J domain-containing protein [Acidobacteriota bacterium]